MPDRGDAHQAASPVRQIRPRAYESRWTWAIESKYTSGAAARPSSRCGTSQPISAYRRANSRLLPSVSR